MTLIHGTWLQGVAYLPVVYMTDNLYKNQPSGALPSAITPSATVLRLRTVFRKPNQVVHKKESAEACYVRGVTFWPKYLSTDRALPQPDTNGNP